MIMRPVDIELLLWYHCRPGEHPQVADRTGAWTDWADNLVRLQLLKYVRYRALDYPKRYELTPRGHYYVTEGICQVPLPEHQFVIPPRDK